MKQLYAGNRHDQILGLTRALAAFIVPFLGAAFIILYVFPERAVDWWAWPLASRMTAFWMGAGYIAGGYFFIRALRARRWHHIAIGFLPVTVFAGLLGVATWLGWNSFRHDRPAFVAWAGLYFTTPFLVLLVWAVNLRADTGQPDAQDASLPEPVRQLAGIASVVVIGAGLLLYMLPALVAPFWPWPLTPLAARVLGAWFVLPGMFGAQFARERRWSAVRYAIQSQLLGIALILFGILRARRDFNPANPLTWMLLFGLASLFAALTAVYVAFERRARGPVKQPPSL